MHLLPCPSCQTDIPVAPSQAGDETDCPNCQTAVAIPKLGQLRQLPIAQSSGDRPRDDASTVQSPSSLGRRATFVVLSLIATISLITAGFCGLRWSLIEAPITSDIHIEALREEYSGLNAAQLIREYEDMDKYGLDLASPYNYKLVQSKKQQWGQNAIIAGGIGGLAILGAIVVSVTGPRKRD